MSPYVRWVIGVCLIVCLGGISPAEEPASQLTDFTVVVAEHVLLWEGKEIVTWEEIEQRIATQPKPSQCYPHFYVTRTSTRQTRFTVLLAKTRPKKKCTGYIPSTN